MNTELWDKKRAEWSAYLDNYNAQVLALFTLLGLNMDAFGSDDEEQQWPSVMADITLGNLDQLRHDIEADSFHINGSIPKDLMTLKFAGEVESSSWTCGDGERALKTLLEGEERKAELNFWLSRLGKARKEVLLLSEKAYQAGGQKQ